jgi:hypothetical protein
MTDEQPTRILEIHTDEPPVTAQAPVVNTNTQEIEHELDLWFNRHFRGPMMAGESDFWVLAQSARSGLSSIVKGI